MKLAIKPALLTLTLFLGASLGNAAVLTVGPSGTYATPCPAIKAANPGDIVEIDFNNGIPYQEPPDPNHGNRVDCRFTNSGTASQPITIEGVNGRAILDAQGGIVQKGIFQVYGAYIVISNLEFRNSACGDNCAGLRIESGTHATPGGGDITVQYSYIHNNEDGVLVDNTGPGTAGGTPGVWASGDNEFADTTAPYITFQYDEFSQNGINESGSTHNMYIGEDSEGLLTFNMGYSWTHDALVGHEMKTRAPHNNIYFNLFTDQAGTSSYLMNFPLGGSTYIVGNTFYKNAIAPAFTSLSNNGYMLWRDVTDNSAAGPAYGPSTPTATAPGYLEDLHFINNTVILDPSNDSPAMVVVSCSNGGDASTCPSPTNGPALSVNPVIENNIFIGPNTAASNLASSEVLDNSLVSNAGQTDPDPTPGEYFVNWTNYNFNLLASTSPIGAGLYPPTLNDGATPDPLALAQDEYVMPTAGVARPTPTGVVMDDGAYSYPAVTLPLVTTPPTLSYNPTNQTVLTPGTITLTLSNLPTPAAGSYNVAEFESENTAIVTSTSATSTTDTLSVTLSPTPAATPTPVTIDIYVGGAWLQATVTVAPGPPNLQSITQDSAGNGETTIHLTNPATNTSGPVTVNLSSADPTVVYMPASVTIPVGSSSAEAGSAIGSLWGPSPANKTTTLTASTTLNGTPETVTLPITVSSPVPDHLYCNAYPCIFIGGAQISNTTSGIVSGIAGDWPIWGGPVTFNSDTPSAVPNQTFEVGGNSYPGSPVVNDWTGQPPIGGPNWYDGFTLNTNPVNYATDVNLTVVINGTSRGPGATITLLPASGAGWPANITVASGANQSSPVGVNFGNSVVVAVTDMNGIPVSGATVSISGSGVNGTTAVTTGNGTATFALAPTALGLLSLTASVGGEPNTNPTVSTGFTETGAPGFLLSLPTGPVAVLYGGTGTFSSTLTNYGFAGEVSFSCVQTTSLSGVTCSAPSSVTLTSAETSVPLTVTVASSGSAQTHPSPSFPGTLPLTSLAFIAALFWRRKGAAKLMLVLLAALAIFGMSACTGNINPTASGPSENAVFTLTASGNGQTTSTTLNLIVNP